MAFTKKFYISDSHFGHQRMLDMQPRPFSDIEDHDEWMIECWNDVVGAEDIIYHLGDFAARLHEVDRINELFGRLNGRKHLVIGNHDVDKKGALHPTLAALDWASRPEHGLRTKDEGFDLWMSHYAARTWPSSHYCSFHFYGHSHGRLEGVGRSRDVGVDVPDVAFTPRTFCELTKGILEAENLRTRAARGNVDAALAILDRAPDVEPGPGDAL